MIQGGPILWMGPPCFFYAKGAHSMRSSICPYSQPSALAGNFDFSVQMLHAADREGIPRDGKPHIIAGKVHTIDPLRVILIGGARILFQSSRLPAPEGGWDLVIFYDEIPEKDGIPPRWYDIIETMRLPFSPHWLAGQPLVGESFAADIRYFFR